VNEVAVWQVEATLKKRTRKSLRKGSRVLQIPKMTVRQVLCRRVRMKCYNATLPKDLIGRAGAADEEWMKWPPRSPDLTSCYFILWGYAKD
jgi:hypothetical protein